MTLGGLCLSVGFPALLFDFREGRAGAGAHTQEREKEREREKEGEAEGGGGGVGRRGSAVRTLPGSLLWFTVCVASVRVSASLSSSRSLVELLCFSVPL